VKLAHVRAGAVTGPALVVDGHVVPLAEVMDDPPSSLDQLVRGGRLGDVPGDTSVTGGVPLVDVSLGPPLTEIRNLICIGRNYGDHLAEEGVDAAPEPPIFAKLPSSVIGPEDTIEWDPDLTGDVDWEAELALVIGEDCRDVPVEAALDKVAAYTCVNDVTARDLQFGDPQWTRGKSLATFCPMGPWLVTPDEVGDVGDLRVRCLVNDVVKQDDTTASMINDVAAIISYCSRAFALRAGDVISTGTPGGVGYFAEPRERLGDGDVVVVEVEGVGSLRNVCRFSSPG